MDALLVEVNEFLQGFEPWQLVVGTFFLVHFVHFLKDLVISAISKFYQAFSFLYP